MSSCLILAIPEAHVTEDNGYYKLALPGCKPISINGYQGNGRLAWHSQLPVLTPPPWLKEAGGRVVGAKIEEIIKHPYHLRMIEAGEYEFRGAKAEVTFNISEHNAFERGDRSYVLPMCTIVITARSAKTALELRRLILGNTLKPTVSWGKHDPELDRDLYRYSISGEVGGDPDESW